MARSAMDVGNEAVGDPVSEKDQRAEEAECGAGTEGAAREGSDAVETKGRGCEGEEGKDPHGPIGEDGSTPDPVESNRDGRQDN